ncbi:MAG: hypothetical protein ABW092_04050 [Candidatus Thiodiazotropha sp.]
MKDMRKVHLLLPEMFWPLEEDMLAKDPARPATLEMLLTRSRRVDFQGNNLDETLFHLFGIANDTGPDYPLGAVTYLGTGGDSANKYWAKATPVHLAADGDRVLLIGPDQLGITSTEAAELVRDFNNHFEQDGLSLLIHHPDDWLLELPECPNIKTKAIDYVVGRHIDNCLPSGADRSKWLNLINEIQMLFHHCDINKQRMVAGSLTINGLWFFGFGELPSTDTTCTAVYSSSSLAKGLARLSNIPHHDLTGPLNDVACIDGESIVVFPGFRASKTTHQLAQWEGALMDVDCYLRQFINERNWDELTIYDCKGKGFKTDRTRLKRGFWRRTKKITEFVQ